MGNYASQIDLLQLELDSILKTKNITIVDLMKKIAIR